MSKCRVVIPMYDIVASREHVRLYTTFDCKASGVKHIKLKIGSGFKGVVEG